MSASLDENRQFNINSGGSPSTCDTHLRSCMPHAQTSTPQLQPRCAATRPQYHPNDSIKRRSRTLSQSAIQARPPFCRLNHTDLSTPAKGTPPQLLRCGCHVAIAAVLFRRDCESAPWLPPRTSRRWQAAVVREPEEALPARPSSRVSRGGACVRGATRRRSGRGGSRPW